MFNQCSHDYFKETKKVKSVVNRCIFAKKGSADPFPREKLDISESKSAENHCVRVVYLLFHCLLHSGQELEQRKDRKNACSKRTFENAAFE